MKVTGFSKVLLKIKIFIKLYFIYPRSKKTQNINSILPGRILTIGDSVVIEEDVDLGPFLEVLPDGLYIGKRTLISYCQKIGKFCSISYDVKIGLAAHPTDMISTSPVFYSKRRGWLGQSKYSEASEGFVEIGHDVLISANVVILAGVKIGNGAIIGAGAVVIKDVEPYTIVGGVPARFIRYRFDDELRKKLQEVQYWNLQKEELLKYEGYFDKPTMFCEVIQKS